MTYISWNLYMLKRKENI